VTVRARFAGTEWHTVPLLGPGPSGSGVRVDPEQVVEFPGDLAEETEDAYVLRHPDGDTAALPKALWKLDNPPKAPAAPAVAAAHPAGGE
jgi:hypothetical protein